ncbi:hypothetical protein BX600DRAFT_468173 [Xylariales sp. PMI_506]|nr:hypothetical protein BX600DRAFT_468173 [Xylariales sp. PMI_506]
MSRAESRMSARASCYPWTVLPPERPIVHYSTLEELQARPIPVWTEGMIYPEVITYSMVIEAIFLATYKPYTRSENYQWPLEISDSMNWSVQFFNPARDQRFDS